MIMVLGPHKKKAEAKAVVKAAKVVRAAEREAQVEAERVELREHAAAAHSVPKPVKPRRPSENDDTDI
jgi:translation initiation factor IF-3